MWLVHLKCNFNGDWFILILFENRLSDYKLATTWCKANKPTNYFEESVIFLNTCSTYNWTLNLFKRRKWHKYRITHNNYIPCPALDSEYRLFPKFTALFIPDDTAPSSIYCPNVVGWIWPTAFGTARGHCSDQSSAAVVWAKEVSGKQKITSVIIILITITIIIIIIRYRVIKCLSTAV